MMMAKKKYILKVNCLDEPGIVAKVCSALYDLGVNITSLDEYADPDTKRFFMRVETHTDKEKEQIEEKLKPVFSQFDGKGQVIDAERKIKLLVMCSKTDHCIVDILAKAKRGALNVEVVAVGSNHEKMRSLVEWYGIPYHYLPITKETKSQQEAEITALYEQYNADLIILARYMQILSQDFCTRHSGKTVNIHHSFLPSFKGAGPYKQAHDRGVKIIGATGHFVTEDLDEGPIICQETIRVNHTHSAKEFAGYGADIESLVLSRSIKYLTEYRVFINDHKTVVLK